MLEVVRVGDRGVLEVVIVGERRCVRGGDDW